MLVKIADRFRVAHALLRHSQADRARIIDFQNRQLRRLVHHAYKNVDYYRCLFDRNGIRPGDIRTVSDLNIIPTTNRSDYQFLPVSQVVACNMDPEKLIVHRTSGTTGELRKIRRTWTEERILNAFKFRAYRYFGVRVTDRILFIRYSDCVHKQDKQSFQAAFQKIGMFPSKTITSRQATDDIVREIVEYAPDVIVGFPSTLAHINRPGDNRNFLESSPRLVIVGGETVTPQARRWIHETFNAPVHEVYGSHEFNVFGWRCRKTGDYHINDDSMVLEVVNNDALVGPGEEGDVVGTNLHSFAMPIIRHRLGDVVTQGTESCACGMPFSTIQSVNGRTMDYFRFPEGRLVHPFELSNIFFPAGDSWIRQYQLVQKREDSIVLRVVALQSPKPEEIANARESMADVLPKGVEFHIEVVSKIEAGKGGKSMVFQSELEPLMDP